MGDKVRIYTKVRDFDVAILKDVITDIPTSSGTHEVANLLGGTKFFDYPKPVEMVEVFASQAGDGDIVLDFFAGSGTTGHAVINLNRGDGRKRKFILVEMGDHFDSVLLRRIQKVMYAPEWRGGRPKEEPKVEGFTDEAMLPEWIQRSPRLIKVLRLECYEDAVYNLSELPSEREAALRKLSETEEWARRYDAVFPEGNPYLLEYFAEALEDGNAAMLRPIGTADGKRHVLAEWIDPERIVVKHLLPGTKDGFALQTVDWLETAATWLGLRHVSYEEVEKHGRTYRILRATREGEQVAVVVRDAEKLDPEADRRFLEEYLKGYRVIVNAPPVAAFEALEDTLRQAMLEGIR